MLWGYGYTVIGTVTWESAAYIARYVTKKINGEIAQKAYAGREPEYVTMSRRPGIAMDWLRKYSSDLYKHDKMVVRDKFICRPAKYYDKIYESNEPRKMQILKYRREKNAKKQTNNTPDQLTLRESQQKQKVKLLYRPYERNLTNAENV
jgi:hypothetical protein